MLENRNFCRFFVFLAARKAKSSWLHYDVKIDVTSGPAFWLVDLNQHPNVNSGESSRRNDDWRKKHQESKKQQRRLPVQSSSFFCEQTFLTSDLGWRLPFLPACFGVRPRVESRRPFAYLLVNDRSFLCRPLSSFTQPQKLQYNYTTLLYATLRHEPLSLRALPAGVRRPALPREQPAAGASKTEIRHHLRLGPGRSLRHRRRQGQGGISVRRYPAFPVVNWYVRSSLERRRRRRKNCRYTQYRWRPAGSAFWGLSRFVWRGLLAAA